MLGQRREAAFGVDDRLLHPRSVLFEQPAQQMRFAGAGIALHKQARRQQFLKVGWRGLTRCGASDLDSNGHSRLKAHVENAVYQSIRTPVPDGYRFPSAAVAMLRFARSKI